jgi:hypothetical protein
MIFLSHTHADKPLVGEIAQVLRARFGQDKVFYDSWSMQPGDGIIDKMNEGLAECKYFFFFISEKSLNSGMVKSEWQPALAKKIKGQSKFVPVRIGDCEMPAILMQSLYIDLYSDGLEVATRKIVDVILEKNTYEPSGKFQNMQAFIEHKENILIVEFRAMRYVEYHSKYIVLINNPISDLKYMARGEPMYHAGSAENYLLSDGQKIKSALLFKKESPTSPKSPFTIVISNEKNIKINFIGAMHYIKNDEFGRELFASIPSYYVETKN